MFRRTTLSRNTASALSHTPDQDLPERKSLTRSLFYFFLSAPFLSPTNWWMSIFISAICASNCSILAVFCSDCFNSSWMAARAMPEGSIVEIDLSS